MRLLLLLSCLMAGLLALASSECHPEEFQCANSRCINLAWKCDGGNDCNDNSDEKGCPILSCADDFFRCNNGKCITERWTCDGSNDCDDHSDEAPELCGSRTCQPDYFKCNDTLKCIPNSWLCDGETNCDSGEDEANCEKTCTENDFQCTNKKCISDGWKCDGTDDCGDNSDELNCTKAETECSADLGERACADGSKCAHESWFCDGEPDCGDGSDEANCTVTENLYGGECDSTSFQCKSSDIDTKCIPMDWKCDGDPDCSDGSDEADCESITCETGERSCGPKTYCIKEKYFCDGEEDCVEGLDEKNCNITTCGAAEFDCKNGKCISDALVCNRKDDCGNSEDEAPERHCPIKNACEAADRGGCEHICVPDGNHPKGRRCECNPGFQAINGSGSDTGCEDINECDIITSCSQHCINTKGSYKCECSNDYQLVDNRFCKAISHQDAELILSEKHELRRYHLSTDHYYSLLGDNEMGAKAMDVDVRNGMIYWADVRPPGIIYRANITSKQRDVVVNTELDEPEGLALDWVHGNLYISDTGLKRIQVLRLADKSRKTLVTDVSDPMALSADPYHGWIYWTRWGDVPGIERCGMNGERKKLIISKDIIWPRGLTIDHFQQRLYWVDAKLHTIASARLDGSDQRLVMKTHQSLTHPFGITIFEDYLYWTDWMTNSVHKASKFGSDESVVLQGLSSPMVIQVLHKSRQPQVENRCQNNGGCSHLCLPIPIEFTDTKALNDKKAECACPDGMMLDGGFTCVKGTEPAVKKPDTTEKPSEPKVVVPGDVTVEPKVVPGETTEGGSPDVPYTVPGNEGAGANEGVESKEATGTKDEGHVAIIAICVVAVVAIISGVVIFLFVRRYKKRNVRSMNFDNPVYRKTTTDDQLIMDSSQSNLPQSMQPLNDEPEIV